MKCNCKEVQDQLATCRPHHALPAELQHALEQCPDCKAAWDRTCRMIALVGLKQYEQPAELTLLRCRTAVRRELLAEVAEREAAWWHVFADSPWAAARFGVAAVLMALLGINLLSPSYVPVIHASGETFDIQRVVEAEAAPQLAADERPNPEFSIMMMSNWSPRVHHGGAFQLIGNGGY